MNARKRSIRRPIRTLALLTLALVFVPVLVTQLARVVGSLLGAEERQYEWVSLEETSHAEVRFHNTEHDLALAGMLLVPSGEGPFPAAVMIQGSGTSHRDSGWYLTLAQHLQEEGIVSVAKSLRTVRCSVHGEQPKVKCVGRQADELKFEISGCCEELISQATKTLS